MIFSIPWSKSGWAGTEMPWGRSKNAAFCPNCHTISPTSCTPEMSLWIRAIGWQPSYSHLVHCSVLLEHMHMHVRTQFWSSFFSIFPLSVFMGLLWREMTFVLVWFPTLNKYPYRYSRVLVSWLLHVNVAVEYLIVMKYATPVHTQCDCIQWRLELLLWRQPSGLAQKITISDIIITKRDLMWLNGYVLWAQRCVTKVNLPFYPRWCISISAILVLRTSNIPHSHRQFMMHYDVWKL